MQLQQTELKSLNMLKANKRLIGTQNASRETLTRIKQITSQFLIGTEMRLLRSVLTTDHWTLACPACPEGFGRRELARRGGPARLGGRSRRATAFQIGTEMRLSALFAVPSRIEGSVAYLRHEEFALPRRSREGHVLACSPLVTHHSPLSFSNRVSMGN